ncbi:MAG: alpha/beta fold hydrolase [Acidobacteriota bacterium]|nr:alpha/beta fold hydrolase [Acidobacteriota bacterium]
MKNLKLIFAVLALLTLTTSLAEAQSEQKFAELGDFKLESGEAIRDCKLGYRTFGTLNADKSNAVLFPTWFGGKSEQLAGNFGKGKMVDDTRFFIIAVDAIGNGISSSPSNNRKQPSEQFPRFTIRDMVNAEHQLVMQTFGIKKLHAVMGISMGGMQTFEWIVAYPEMMKLAIPIVGTTRQTAFDLLLWSTELKAIDEARKLDTADNAGAAMVARIHALALFTPAYRNSAISPKEFEAFVKKEEQNYLDTFKADDWASQLRAMMAHDVSKKSGSMAEAAKTVKAKVLVVVARQDMMVNPDPAIEFARLLKSELLEVNNACGHVYATCEGDKVNAAVTKFLTQ